jgi:hypothetical protein
MDMQHCDCENENCEKCGDKMMWKMKRREYRAIRALMAIIVVIFVFWCGFEFGEIRASANVGRGFGYNMMQGGGIVRYNNATVRPITQQPSSVPAQTSTNNK